VHVWQNLIDNHVWRTIAMRATHCRHSGAEVSAGRRSPVTLQYSSQCSHTEAQERSVNMIPS